MNWKRALISKYKLTHREPLLSSTHTHPQRMWCASLLLLAPTGLRQCYAFPGGSRSPGTPPGVLDLCGPTGWVAKVWSPGSRLEAPGVRRLDAL